MSSVDEQPTTACKSSTSSEALPLMALNDTKAGMDGLDTERINVIIQEASKGSKFFAAKERSQRRVAAQVERMRQQLARITPSEVTAAEAEMDTLSKSFVPLDLSHTIVHVDMDAFYAAVETRDDPSLGRVPMAVGSMGMLSTSNYLARRFGVRAGMPGFIGKKLCPHLKLVPLNFNKYRAVSNIVRGIFAEYDPGFVPMSLDEAYLDLTHYLAKIAKEGTPASPEEVVNEIRAKICERTEGLTASAGIAPNTLLAKVCSDQNKPNGQFRLPRDGVAIQEFVSKMTIRKIGGIGAVTEQLLRDVLDIRTCGDLFLKRGLVKLLFSEVASRYFLRVSVGSGSNNLVEWNERERKSLSTETTFRDTSDEVELFDICSRLCHDLSGDLKKHGLQGKAVTLKIKTDGFQIRTKVTNLLEPTCDENVIETACRGLLRHFIDASEEKPLKLRLLGVRMSDFPSDDKASSITTLTSFLKKNMKKQQVYHCPICQEEVPARNEIAFNAHLDQCLGGEADNASTVTVPGRIQPCGVMKEQQNDVERLKPEAGAAQIKTALAKPTAATNEMSGGIAAGRGDSDSDPATDSHVECPVCGRQLQNDDFLVNRHIDECLSLSEINNKRKDFEFNDMTKRSKKQKSCDITRYFTTVPTATRLK